MAPAPHKRKSLHLLLILLLISLSLLFIFSLSPSNPKPQIQPLLHENPTPNLNPDQSFTFIIKVLTFDRLSSLSRCLTSLSKAHYDMNDKVHLHIFVDHFLQDSSNGLDQKLNLSRKILDFVDGFDWSFGEKLVHYRTANAGLQAQWIEAWWPASDHEFAFVVEDDLEVSPLYYRFLKAVIMNYYYNASNFSPSIYGASLQRPRFVPGKHGNKIQLDDGTWIFLYQLVGTWGQLLFPRPWKEFRLWYNNHRSKNMKPFLEGMVTTGWYKKLGEKIWTPWFIKFIQSHGYFNIYTNFPRERALSISHRDPGVNYRKTAGPDSYLMDENSSDFNLSKLLPLNDLKWYDFCFREVLTNRIVGSSHGLGLILSSVQKNNSVILVSLYRVHEAVIRNMLCHFEKLNVRNYVLVGPMSHVLLDLARRGYPVIDASQFSDVSNIAKSIFQDSTAELIKEILVSAYVTRKCLNLGYSTWMLEGNMLPRRGDSFYDPFGHTNDVFIGKTSRLLFVRSSSSTLKIWADDFVYKIVSLFDALPKHAITHDWVMLNVVEKLLEQQSIKFDDIDEMHLGLDIGIVQTNSTSSFEKENKFVCWSSRTKLDRIRAQLEHLDLWVLDGDFSCTGVFCHPS